MKFLHVMRSVNPEDGGPIEALMQSDPAWRQRGHGREIVSLDVPGDPWVWQCPIPVHAMGSPSVRRAARRVPLLRYGFTPRLVPWLRANVGRFDAVVVNGLWNYAGWAARRVLPYQAKPYFVFTHGMLDPWFRSAHPAKHWAKQLAWLLCEEPLLRHAEAVLFTSAGEQASADRAFWPYRFEARVCGYGTAMAPPFGPALEAAAQSALPGLNGRSYLLFLGRLHPKKGCDLLVRGFARIAATHPGLDLVIAGPDPVAFRSDLQALAETLGVAARVHWPGMLRGDGKWGALHGCAAFVLPSHGENFAVAAVEALACGKPVLLSDRVAIAGEITASGAGLVAPDTEPGTADLLARFLAMPESLRAVMAARARQCFARSFDIDQVADGALAILGAGRGS